MFVMTSPNSAVTYTVISYTERQLCREKTVEVLQEKILYIAELMNRHEFVPKLPTESDIDLVFDTSYPDIQPYLFKVC
jgi:autophagy-related protein 101